MKTFGGIVRKRSKRLAGRGCRAGKKEGNFVVFVVVVVAESDATRPYRTRSSAKFKRSSRGKEAPGLRNERFHESRFPPPKTKPISSLMSCQTPHPPSSAPASPYKSRVTHSPPFNRAFTETPSYFFLRCTFHSALATFISSSSSRIGIQLVSTFIAFSKSESSKISFMASIRAADVACSTSSPPWKDGSERASRS